MNRLFTYSQQPLGMRLWRGVTLQLFLVAVLPLTLLLLVVTFGSLELHHDAMQALVAERNLWAVQTAAASLDREVIRRGAVLEMLAGQLPGEPQTQGFSESVTTRLSVFDGGVAVFTVDGWMLAHTDHTDIQKLPEHSAWTSIQERFASVPVEKAVYLSIFEIQGQMYLPVLVKSPSGSVLVGLIHPGRLLAQGLATVASSETTRVLVVDASHHTLYQSGPFRADENDLAHSEIQGALDGSSGIDHTQTSSGEQVLTSSPIPTVGWALLVEESWDDIASPLLRATQNAPIIFIPVLGLGLLALWFGLRQIVQPIQALEGKAGDLARGNFETIRKPVGGVPEIRHLQTTLIGMAEQLEEAQNSLHSYIGAITASVESERQNLARELHDETLQSMIALGQYTQYALHWNTDPKVNQTLEQVLNLSDQGVKNLRRLVRGLRPIYIEDLGLTAALSMEAGQRDIQDKGVKIHFRQEGIERRLKPEVEMALYRIAQEALSNVSRHADAVNAWITLYFQPDMLVMEVRDDGRGFNVPGDPAYFARLGHYGLLSLHERAELIKAKLTIQSSLASGTLVQVRVPTGEQGKSPQNKAVST